MNTGGHCTDELWVCHLGLVPYSDGLAIQETLRRRRIAGEIPDTLLLLEHPPTYTCGRRASAQELPFPHAFYEARGIEVHATDRGGKVTYHGPGQLVGYPIMAVGDVGAYLRTMENAIVSALGETGVSGRSRHAEGIDYTGVWVAERKIASIGLHISRGISTHGFAVNVENDLEPFSWVVACGLPEVQMTSLAAESHRNAADAARRGPHVAGAGRCTTDGVAPAAVASAGRLQAAGAEGLSCFRKRMAHAFARAHGRRQRLCTPARIGLDTANASPSHHLRQPVAA